MKYRPQDYQFGQIDRLFERWTSRAGHFTPYEFKVSAEFISEVVRPVEIRFEVQTKPGGDVYSEVFNSMAEEFNLFNMFFPRRVSAAERMEAWCENRGYLFRVDRPPGGPAEWTIIVPPAALLEENRIEVTYQWDLSAVPVPDNPFDPDEEIKK